MATASVQSYFSSGRAIRPGPHGAASRAVAADDLRAQHGEDRILAEHFGDKTDGTYVEVGAYNGVDISNTYYFEKRGWTGVLIEADPALAEQCRRHRPRSTVVNCAVVGPGSPPTATFHVVEQAPALSSLSLDQDGGTLKWVQETEGRLDVRPVTVAAMTLDRVLEDAGVEPGRIDFMTIDVEGHEWPVLRGFTASKWRPQVLIIERNALLPDRRIMDYLHRNHYLYQFSTNVNDWFHLAPRGAARGLGYRTRYFWTFHFPKLARHYRNRLRDSVDSALRDFGWGGALDSLFFRRR